MLISRLMSVPAAEASAQPRPTRARSRVEVADIAVRLFRTDGYEATTATDIARAAGISRSTFFRQFRSKEDVIFADHDELAVQITAYFAVQHEDPWRAIRDAATMVFERFRERLDSVRVRDLVVRDTPTLRDRETIMAIRYEQMFAAYLRSARPDVPPLTAIRYAAAITATHNYELRRLIRGAIPASSPTNAAGDEATDAASEADRTARLAEELATELREVGRLFHPDVADSTAGQGQAVHGQVGESPPELVVAVFPGTITPGELTREVTRALGGRLAGSAPGADAGAHRNAGRD
ncbi:helix-turn-helix domain-containing protein [Cryobacterium sp. 5B3]|uniref:TetR/AcrR family transcriptional regulator n=2 Tax=Cryobacterium sp. 5B3 TaxID=3048586 RepID=UPI002B2370D3|nr:helix-turn-helix domain-containing protein [Cryobacterium sp. 5B3]MEB0275331.1 helix-turn-helix domain-containing protein [Cryobacterium sp. 5B3]